jgi:hypothetical protein
MRATAPLFFGRYQRMLVESIYLNIQRLLDPTVNARGEKTMSLETLLKTIPTGATYAPLARKLRKELRDLRTSCKEIKEWRNRAIAHLDLPTRFKEHPRPLGAIKKETVRVSIGRMHGFLQDFGFGVYNGLIVPMQTEMMDGNVLMSLMAVGVEHHPAYRLDSKSAGAPISPGETRRPPTE